MTNNPSPARQLPRRCQLALKAHTGPCHVARYDSNGRYLLTAGADRTIKLWNASAASGSSDAAQPKPIKTYTSGHSYEILALDVSPDNSRFASGGGDKNVLLWDVATSTILRRFSAHEGRINDVRFAGPASAQGSSVLCTVGFDAILRFYDLRAQGAWRPIMECKEAKDAIQTMAIRGEEIWTGSVDGVLRCYDMRKGEVREDTVDGESKGSAQSLSGEGLTDVGTMYASVEPIVSVHASTSGSLLLVSTTASTHRLFDTSDGSLLQTFMGHTNTSYRCHSTLTSTEDAVLAGDEKGRLRVWDVLSGKEMDVANGRASSTPEHDKTILWTECNPKKLGEVVTSGADGNVKVWSG